MKIGVVYPQTEYGNDPIAIRDYAQQIEELGYTHIVAYDHILGANPDRPGGWQGAYTYQSAFQEPFVLFSYMAGFTRKIGFTSGIIILPQRQTALVAKQAATLDVLSQGRLRLGIGLGWNEVEYISLGMDFHNRGKRIEEQITVLRQLWTQPLVKFTGKWHSIPDAGLNPLPVQQPIPIWMGGTAEPAVWRAVSLADGWMPNFKSASQAQQALDFIHRTLDETGRSLEEFGIEARIPFGNGDPAEWEQLIQGWQENGANYFSVNTMGCGFKSPEAHLRALETFARATGVSG